MSAEGNYWSNKVIRRRTALRGAAIAGGSALAASILACGGGSSTPSATKKGDTPETVDITKGKPGGKLFIGKSGFPNSQTLIDRFANAQVAGLVHSALLNFQAGKAGVDGSSVDVEPDLAVAMPEQPDQTTYVFKLRPNAKFHNGRTLTSEDVKYSLDRYAGWELSAYKGDYSWIDKVEAVDPQTVRVRSKAPFADALVQLAVYHSPFIVAKEHEESKDAALRQMGSGPFIWDEVQAPISVTVKKNPDYYQKPFPYLDSVTFVFNDDLTKTIADFNSKQVQVPNFFSQEARDEIKRTRPDAVLKERPGAGQSLTIRTDKAPWNDKRVRQALSMSVDRKQVRDGVFKGEGEDDQNLSIINAAWGFRKPGQLKSAKYWKFDPAEAKKLLAAAGITESIKRITTLASNNQELVDIATLITARWRELGVIESEVKRLTGSQLQTTLNIGQYDDLGVQFNQQNIVMGNFLRNRYWSPPEGVTAPTSNAGHVNDPELSRLLDKQNTQLNHEERKSTFREMEEIFGEQQYRVIFSTYSQSWFWDPSVKGIDMPLYAYQGAFYFPKWWWLA